MNSLDQIMNEINKLPSDQAAGVGAIGGTFFGIIITVFVVLAIFRFIVFILELIVNWKIMKKTGEPGWKSIIPIYGSYTFWKKFWEGKKYFIYLLLECAAIFLLQYARICYEYIRKNPQFFQQISLTTGSFQDKVLTIGILFGFYILPSILLIVCTIISLVYYVKYIRRVSRAFGKKGFFTFCLFFFTLITKCVIAFGRSEYIGNMNYTFDKNYKKEQLENNEENIEQEDNETQPEE